jgi:hypothetical protein
MGPCLVAASLKSAACAASHKPICAEDARPSDGGKLSAPVSGPNQRSRGGSVHHQIAAWRRVWVRTPAGRCMALCPPGHHAAADAGCSMAFAPSTTHGGGIQRRVGTGGDHNVRPATSPGPPRPGRAATRPTSRLRCGRSNAAQEVNPGANAGPPQQELSPCRVGHASGPTLLAAALTTYLNRSHIRLVVFRGRLLVCERDKVVRSVFVGQVACFRGANNQDTDFPLTKE